MKETIKNFTDRFTSYKKDSVVLGTVSGPLGGKEVLTEGQLNHHVHIVGASGFGKTVMLSHLIKQRIQQGKGLMFIDLKGDRDTLMKFSAMAIDAGRVEDLQVFSLTERSLSIPYNLLSNGTATQLRDRIVQSLNWSEEYYKNVSSSFLLKTLIVLCWLRDNANFPLHIGHVLKCCTDKEYLTNIAMDIPKSELLVIKLAREVTIFLNESDNYKSLQGLRSQVESLTMSDFGNLITSEKPGIELFETVRAGKIIFLFLDTRRYGETAKTMGRFILQDLKATAAKVDAEVPKADRKPFSVVIDEFADLAAEDFIGFLDRARSSKMSIVVAHQEISDLDRVSPEFAGRLMGNTSTLYAFLQKRPESADLISKMAGTTTVREATEQYDRKLFIPMPTGMMSVKTVEKYRIRPNQIKSLTVGKCVVVKKYPKSRAYVVNVAPE